MNIRLKVALAVGGLSMSLFASIAGIALAIGFGLDGGERAALNTLLEPHAVIIVLALAIAGATLAFLATPLVRLYLAGPAKLAEQARIVLGANRAHRLRGGDSAELDTLADLVNQLADQRDTLHIDVERRIRESQAELEEEKNRLAALVSELAEGVIACNLDGRILLYNNRARLLFAALAPGGAAGGGLIGLGRSIFSVIERPLIEHALANIRHRQRSGDQRALANFVTAGRAGELIRVQMAPVLTAIATATVVPDALSGYVLVLENITRSFEADSRRDQALRALTEGSRAALANIRAAIETLAGYPDMPTEQRERFVGVIAQEVQAASERLEENAARHAQTLRALSVLEEMRGADLIAAAQRTIESRLAVAVQADPIAPALWVRADSFAIVRALAWLAERLHTEFGAAQLNLRLTQTERLAQLDLVWPQTSARQPALHAWQQALQSNAESSPLHEVAERHGGEAWFAGDDSAAYWRLLLPLAQPPRELAQRQGIAERPEYHDFALFDQAAQVHALDDRSLAELTYTVFDTETTGLAPDDGDQIIQIGALRIVNLRLLRNEAFDQLVDPRRRLGRGSAAVHGISEDMLRGQPSIDEVLPAFHAYCQDTVLVGHNAAFDMRFLQMKEASTGLRFEQPLLDTLLLSEVIHPAQESHRLEAIAERLGVRIEARHNALGDAIITAEVFVRMVGLLADAGIRTLRDALAAAARTRAARVRY